MSLVALGHEDPPVPLDGQGRWFGTAWHLAGAVNEQHLNEAALDLGASLRVTGDPGTWSYYPLVVPPEVAVTGPWPLSLTREGEVEALWVAAPADRVEVRDHGQVRSGCLVPRAPDEPERTDLWPLEVEGLGADAWRAVRGLERWPWPRLAAWLARSATRRAEGDDAGGAPSAPRALGVLSSAPLPPGPQRLFPQSAEGELAAAEGPLFPGEVPAPTGPLLRVVLLTAARLAQGHRPGPERLAELGVALRAAAVGAPRIELALEQVEGVQTTARRVAAEGTVYWFEVLDGDAAGWAARHHLTCLADDPEDRRRGHGLMAVGVP